MKEVKDMTTDELVDWAGGTLICAIGRGDFRAALIGILLTVQSAAYERGLSERKRKR